MKIYFHHLETTAVTITDDDLQYLFELFSVPMNLFNDYTIKSTGTRVLTHKDPQTGGESIAISIPIASYAIVKLHGAFFDNYPDFPVHKFWAFIKGKGNCIRTDVSFEDTEHVLDFDEIRRMSLTYNYKNYLTGSAILDIKRKQTDDVPDSSNRHGVPDVHANHKIIHYGNVGSPTSGRAYVRKNGNIKFEIVIIDKKYTAPILDSYTPETIDVWRKLVTGALIKFVNFVTPSSKRAKRPVKVEFWKNFLDSDLRPICWKDHVPIQDAAEISFDSAISTVFGRLHNIAARFLITEDLKEDIDALREKFVTAFTGESEWAHIQL